MDRRRFGEEFKAWMAGKDYREVALDADTHYSTLYNWARGAAPRPHTFEVFAQKVGMEPEWYERICRAAGWVEGDDPTGLAEKLTEILERNPSALPPDTARRLRELLDTPKPKPQPPSRQKITPADLDAILGQQESGRQRYARIRAMREKLYTAAGYRVPGQRFGQGGGEFKTDEDVDAALAVWEELVLELNPGKPRLPDPDEE